ncbi:MAG: hypothetical protein HC927_08395 [Deltaproteobacteria bacterium]|nr:hypothetical protein [Deltaproteobacteria bacterium]
MTPDDCIELVEPAPDTRRKALCLVSGVALSLLGFGLNLDRFGPGADERIEHAADSAEIGQYATPGPLPTNSGPVLVMTGSIPQFCRNFDPDLPPRNNGILGMVVDHRELVLANPPDWEVGKDDEDGWVGMHDEKLEKRERLGEIQGVAGPLANQRRVEDERFVTTRRDSESGFSIAVGTTSYSQVNRRIRYNGKLPDPELVRTEEMINYFDYDYAEPGDGQRFSVITEVGPCPWNPSHRLVHIGLQTAGAPRAGALGVPPRGQGRRGSGRIRSGSGRAPPPARLRGSGARPRRLR